MGKGQQSQARARAECSRPLWETDAESERGRGGRPEQPRTTRGRALPAPWLADTAPRVPGASEAGWSGPAGPVPATSILGLLTRALPVLETLGTKKGFVGGRVWALAAPDRRDAPSLAVRLAALYPRFRALAGWAVLKRVVLGFFFR